MQALVVNAVGGGFNLEEVRIGAPMGREVLVDVQASGLCHTDPLNFSGRGKDDENTIRRRHGAAGSRTCV